MLLLLAWILLLLGSLLGAVIYRRTGSEVVISSGSDHSRITAITWKHNEDMAVEWYGGKPSVYRHFNGHTTLDIWTGALTISGLTRDHSGSYTAEINNRIANTTEVQVISPVPKPTVSKQCDAEMTDCTLTCEGNTTDSEPVTCSWQIPDTQNYHEGQWVNITKENPEPWYRCVMENPISSETSEKFSNPFSPSNQTVIIILVLSILFLLLIGVIVGIVIHRRRKSKKGKFFSSRIPESNDQTEEEDEWTGEESSRLLEGSFNEVETSIQVPQTSSVVPDTNTQTEMLNSCEASNPDKTSKKPDDEPEISPDQVQTSEEIPKSGALTENSPKKEEEIKVQVHKSETPENNTQTEESAETSNGNEATRLEERNYIISVSA